MVHVGHLIRQSRHEKDLTIASVSAMTGFSVSYISQVEREKVTPSISALTKIAAVLNIPMTAFWQTDTEGQGNHTNQEPFCKVVGATERKSFKYPDSDVDYELLSPDFKRTIELIRMVIHPGQVSARPPFSHEGEEVGYIVRGTLEYTVGDNCYLLNAGDTIYFESTTPHHWRVIGDEEVEAIWAIVPPSF
jgi:transcriptional regulator with XRE-family HTH domain